MNLETVIYEVKDNVAKITMNRPDKRNALNHRLLNDLGALRQRTKEPQT